MCMHVSATIFHVCLCACVCVPVFFVLYDMYEIMFTQTEVVLYNCMLVSQFSCWHMVHCSVSEREVESVCVNEKVWSVSFLRVCTVYA